VRIRLAALCAAALVLPAGAAGAPPFKVTLQASTHTPKVNTNWFYVVSVTKGRNRLVRATVTTQIVDPYGGVHAVEFGCCAKRNVVGHPFTGDVVIFPPEAKGFRVNFRVTVRALGAKRVLTYWVKPR
jgi:hypothetical protein